MPEVPQGPGGGGELSGIATVVGSHRDTEGRGGTNAIDVEVIEVTTIPHGIYFERAVPYKSFQENGYGPLVAPIAEAIEYALQNGFADDAAYVQTITAANEIRGVINFYISIPGTLTQPGPFTDVVPVTVQELYDGTGPQPQINAAKVALKTAVGL